MMTLIQDVRDALRSARQNPGLMAAAVLSLAIGIGANTTIFSWVQAVLLRPIPGAADPDRLFIAAMENREGASYSWSYPNYRDVRDGATLVDLIAQDDLTMSVGVDGQAERGWGGLVSGNFFQVLGVGASLGRVLSPDDDRIPGAHPVVVLSHAYWQRRFAGDPAVLGRVITINTVPCTVIGVADQRFIGAFLGLQTSAWVPMAMQASMTGADRLEARGSGWMQAFARLRPGASREQASAELASQMRQLEVAYPTENSGRRVRLARMWESDFGAASVLAPVLAVLAAVVALVLIITCVNVANLLLARAVGRRREVAIRLSLGASRRRLLRQLLTESLLLALVAGILGIVMAFWAADLLMAFLPPIDVPLDLGIRIDERSFLFALGVSLLTGIAFGLAPAWQASSPSTVNALKEETGRGSGGRTGHRLRGALVVVQIAVCLLLLVSAGLFIRSLAAAQRIDPGFDTRGLLTASIDLAPSGYTPETGRAFQRRLLQSVSNVPGVRSATLTRYVPLGFSGSSSMRVSIDGYVPQPNEDVVVAYVSVGPRYFETMRIPLNTGRDFDRRDVQGAEPVAVVNATMAERYWPGGSAVGGRLHIGDEEHRIVAVAQDIKYQSLNERPRPVMYLSLEQHYAGAVALQLRTEAPASGALQEIRQVVRTLDANLPLFDARSFDEHMQGAAFAQKIGAYLLGAMGALALVLAIIGLYGVMAYSVSQRTREVGIRLALGARPRDVVGLIVRQGATLALTGLSIGLIASLSVSGLLTSLLPGITPRDPLTFAGVAAGLLAVALAASWFPARRAGGVDPATALRAE